MSEIDCICCGAEIDRSEKCASTLMQSMCDACSREVEAAGASAELDADPYEPTWVREQLGHS
jgi:hypothetical protein